LLLTGESFFNNCKKIPPYERLTNFEFVKELQQSGPKKESSLFENPEADGERSKSSSKGSSKEDSYFTFNASLSVDNSCDNYKTFCKKVEKMKRERNIFGWYNKDSGAAGESMMTEGGVDKGESGRDMKWDGYRFFNKVQYFVDEQKSAELGLREQFSSDSKLLMLNASSSAGDGKKYSVNKNKDVIPGAPGKTQISGRLRRREIARRIKNVKETKEKNLEKLQILEVKFPISTTSPEGRIEPRRTTSFARQLKKCNFLFSPSNQT
jgi:hypothetical protein